jgi:amino acid adenylation domain-containing protein
MAFLLDQLVTNSAEHDPDAVAVQHDDSSLTYGELEESSNRIARTLVDFSVRPGDRVGLHLQKSLTAVAAVYGILKAGACYVPVDAANPAPRLAAIASQCEMRVLIASGAATEKFTGEAFRDSPLEHVLLVDASPDLPFGRITYSSLDEAASAHEPVAPARRGIDQDLAYVLFTSGSTGTPKGVMLTHLNALTFVNWGYEVFDVTADDRLSNHASFSFDLSVFDLFVAAKAGASVVLVPERVSMFPVRLADLLEHQRITIWYSVPSILRMLLEHGGLERRRLNDLRLVLFAGEVFPTKFLRELMAVLPDPGYFNLYGPTETNVCTYYEVEPIPDTQTAPIPIGKSCANTDAFALDEDGRAISEPGQEGVLYVRGSTVMQGYFGRPEETAKAFVRNPLNTDREEPLYCTQDWVTLDDAENFLFLGRKDQLVKSGGYRIELGEIEAALYSHSAVEEAVALALPDDLLGNRIRAVVAADTATGLTEQDVRGHCGARLPKYMVPHDVEIRTSLPRTPNNKIDRARLREESLEAAGKA